MSEQHYERIADFYDVFVRTEVDIPFFVNEARKTGGEVLELMAGTGRLTIPLLQAGILVTAVDYSAEMLKRLQAKLDESGLSADIRQMDIRYLEFDRQFKQIIIPFQAFHELTSDEDQRQALDGIRRYLADDGTFICTLHNPARRLKDADGLMRLAGRFPLEQNQLFVWLLQTFHLDTKLVNVIEFFEEFDPQGRMVSKRFSELSFKLIDKLAFELMIADAGFEVVQLHGTYTYSKFEDAHSPFMIWVLRKGWSRRA